MDATNDQAREVQQFVGFVSYYGRFVQDFASIARPLHRLALQLWEQLVVAD